MMLDPSSLMKVLVPIRLCASSRVCLRYDSDLCISNRQSLESWHRHSKISLREVVAHVCMGTAHACTLVQQPVS